jgi:hypothetical protein
MSKRAMDPAARYVSSREFPLSVMQIVSLRLADRVSEAEAELLAMDIAEDVNSYVERVTLPRCAA